MEKNCMNCKHKAYCQVRQVAAFGESGDQEYIAYCSLYEPKKMTVKLYAYLKEDDGCYEFIWHTYTNLNADRYTRVPSEDKEIEI